MSWVFLLVIAYFFISLTALADKFLLTKALPHPVVYVFYISVLSLLVLILIPWGFFIPTLDRLLLPALAGVTFTVGLYFLFSALRVSEASRVFATSGSLAASFTFVFSMLFLGERLSQFQILGFILLVLGGVLVGLELGSGKSLSETGFWFSLLTALSFGVAYTSTKQTYSDLGFIPGFIWIRSFAFLAVLPFLIPRQNRLYLKSSWHQERQLVNWWHRLVLISGQTFSAVGFLILNYVISLTSASLVLAAQGLQYGFLFVSTTFISHKFPAVISEKITPGALSQKIFALVLIALGLAALAQVSLWP